MSINRKKWTVKHERTFLLNLYFELSKQNLHYKYYTHIDKVPELFSR